MNKRIQAFTIMEVTVAMLLAAVVIGITYTCYSIIYQGYAGFRDRQQQLVWISQLDQVLDRDLEKADIIRAGADGLVLRTDTQRITYRILPDMVIRIAAIPDTFKIATRELERSFEGAPVADEARIDELRFVMFRADETYIYHYYRSYSSQQLFNTTSNGQN